MLIAVLSDTHVPYRAKKLPDVLLSGLKKVDLIIHAGDWQTLEVYETLRQFAPVEGVAGNTDGPEVVRRWGWKRIINVGAYKIGVVHGHGGDRSKTAERAYLTFADEGVDLIIFGHTHVPFLEKRKGVLLFNPGSPTDKRRMTHYSYGLIHLSNGLEAKHIYF